MLTCPAGTLDVSQNLRHFLFETLVSTPGLGNEPVYTFYRTRRFHVAYPRFCSSLRNSSSSRLPVPHLIPRSRCDRGVKVRSILDEDRFPFLSEPSSVPRRGTTQGRTGGVSARPLNLVGRHISVGTDGRGTGGGDCVPTPMSYVFREHKETRV